MFMTMQLLRGNNSPFRRFVALGACAVMLALPVASSPRRPLFVEEDRGTQVDPKDFHRKQREFIIQEVSMTEEEASLFFPVYNAQKRQLHEIRRKIRKACQRVDAEQLSEKDCERVLQEIQKLQSQYAALEAEGYMQWRKFLPASKVLKVLNAERKFNRQLLKKREAGKGKAK